MNKADKMFKDLGYKKKEKKALNYIEYIKSESDGDMTISFDITNNKLSFYVRKYIKIDGKVSLQSVPESFYVEELEAIYQKYLELIRRIEKLPITKKLVYYDYQDKYNVVPVIKFVSKDDKTFEIYINKDGKTKTIKIHKDYFRQMQKPNFLEIKDRGEDE